VSLAEAFAWLGLLPLAAYWATFTPAFFYVGDADPVRPLDFVGLHRQMTALQDSVTTFHNYQSLWWQWMLNLRLIWYLYEAAHGMRRGVLLLGNPLNMLAGLPALAWGGWAALARKRADALVMLACCAVILFFWPLSGKPVQFYYHYLLPGVFLAGALALALDAGWRRGRAWRGAIVALVAASFSLFA